MRRERTALGMNRFAHVAIDGPAGSGKTTVARALARRLDFLYLDTGAMYRAVALAALRAGADPQSECAMLALARARPVDVRPEPATELGFRIFAGAQELGPELYGNDVSRVVSAVAAHAAVRALLVERQREIAGSGPVVMAGRDIGTVVLPHAPYKIFLTASADERARRRAGEFAANGTAVDVALVREELIERDRLDSNRAVAPLRPAADAVVIDSSLLGVDDVVERIAGLVRSGTADARA